MHDHLNNDRRIASVFLQSDAMNFLTFSGIHVRHDAVFESVVFLPSAYRSAGFYNQLTFYIAC